MSRKTTYSRKGTSRISHKTSSAVRPERYRTSELKPMYLELSLSKDQLKLLRRYFRAMANLYGIISLRDAYDVICTLMENPPTLEEFLAFAEIARHEMFFYVLGDDEVFDGVPKADPADRKIIAHEILLDGDPEWYEEIADDQGGKPLYVPDSEKELLMFAKKGYVEKTPQSAALVRALQSMPGCTKEEAETVPSEIQGMIQVGMALPSILELLQKHGGVVFRNIEEAQEFLNVLADFHNSVHRWGNRGFSPSRLREEYERTGTQSGGHRKTVLQQGKVDIIEDKEPDADELISQVRKQKDLPRSMRKKMARALSKVLPGKRGPKR